MSLGTGYRSRRPTYFQPLYCSITEAGWDSFHHYPMPDRLLRQRLVCLFCMIQFRDEDLEITHLKGSGPGGQNRNKRMTAVRIKHLPTGIVVTASERRSQEQNKEMALERLRSKLEALFHKPKARIKTKVTRTAQRERLVSKKIRSKKKESRRLSREEFES